MSSEQVIFEIIFWIALTIIYLPINILRSGATFIAKDALSINIFISLPAYRFYL
jgi:hypothetical protein